MKPDRTTPWLTSEADAIVNYPSPSTRQSMEMMPLTPSVTMINGFPYRTLPLKALGQPGLRAIAHLCPRAWCTSSTNKLFLSFFFLKDFIYLFLDRGGGKEKERERNVTV